MKRYNGHYEKYKSELGRPLTSEEERLLDIAESYITVESQDQIPQPETPPENKKE